jgi:hypothetical protein
MSTIRAPYEIFLTRGRARVSRQDAGRCCWALLLKFPTIAEYSVVDRLRTNRFPTGTGFLVGACVSLQLAGR